MKKWILFFAFLQVMAFADYDSEIRNLKLEKEKLQGDIQKLNGQIIATDSMLKADDSRYQVLEKRYAADTQRRRLEIDSLNIKIKKLAESLQEERNKQAHAKNKSDNVLAKRKALRSVLTKSCKQLETQILNTLPWEREMRLGRIKSLTQDLESGNATEEEGFSRLKSLILEEIKFGDQIVSINSPLTLKNGEIINAIILRIGNQWMVYSDDNGTVFGRLVRKLNGENIEYEWDENLNLEERSAIKFAIDVKLAKKPPQMIKLPISLSVENK